MIKAGDMVKRIYKSSNPAIVKGGVYKVKYVQSGIINLVNIDGSFVENWFEKISYNPNKRKK